MHSNTKVIRKVNVLPAIFFILFSPLAECLTRVEKQIREAFSFCLVSHCHAGIPELSNANISIPIETRPVTGNAANFASSSPETSGRKGRIQVSEEMPYTQCSTFIILNFACGMEFTPGPEAAGKFITAKGHSSLVVVGIRPLVADSRSRRGGFPHG